MGLIVSLIAHVLLIFLFTDYRSDHQSASLEQPRLLELQLFPAESVTQAYTPSKQISSFNKKTGTLNKDKPITRKSALPKHVRTRVAADFQREIKINSTDTPSAAKNSSVTAPHNERKMVSATNMNQIRKNIGKIVKEIDQERSELAVSQLDNNPIYTANDDTPFAREVSAAGRPDCVTANALPGGLLAPIYLLMEKNGTGCKF